MKIQSIVFEIDEINENEIEESLKVGRRDSRFFSFLFFWNGGKE